MPKDQRKKSKRSSIRKEKLDSISNLPSDIVEKILAHLPIKEAMRTSILSTKWRYKPAMLQILKFDEQCESTRYVDSDSDSDTTKTRFAHIVDQVLLLHIGNIYEFELSHRDFSAAAAIDRWLLHLSRSSVKCLKLVIPGKRCNSFWGKRYDYKLPACFFSCQDLIHLKLHCCLLKPPSTSRGFKSLEHLEFDHVTLSQHVFDGFIVGCPKLKTLILKDCDGFNNFCIDVAPNLKSLAIDGCFLEDVSLQNTLNLASVDIKLGYNERWVGGTSANSLKFYAHLPNIRELHLRCYSLKYFALDPLLGKLPQPLQLLNYFHMGVDFTSVDQIRTAVCLIRSSPALQRLQIKVKCGYFDDEEEADSWFENFGYKSDCQLTELRRIEIGSITCATAELDFIKFLLLSSPVLECMTLECRTYELFLPLEQLKEVVVRFRRASLQARIIFLDP